MATDHQFNHRMEELDIFVRGVHLGMWDCSAVVDVTWDRVAEDWIWDITDWMIHDERGGEVSLNRVSDEPLMRAVKLVLDAQIPKLSDAIERAIAEQMLARPKDNEHRLRQSEFI